MENTQKNKKQSAREEAENENVPNSTIDWRKLVNPKYLVPNMSKVPHGTAQKSLNVEELDDSQLLILLAGIKDLASLRGFSSVTYHVHACSPQYVAVSCKIIWNPSPETNNLPVEFESLADAHLENTKSFAKDFLMAIAENRAFVRCVRNYLRINIVGSDEIGDPNKGEMPEVANVAVVSSTHPASVLNDLMKKAGLTFETIKATMEKEGDVDAKNWNATYDIPNKTIFSLIQRIRKKINPNEDH
jgi:hypothetical protein